jgi:hypothetical protein
MLGSRTANQVQDGEWGELRVRDARARADRGDQAKPSEGVGEDERPKSEYLSRKNEHKKGIFVLYSNDSRCGSAWFSQKYWCSPLNVLQFALNFAFSTCDTSALLQRAAEEIALRTFCQLSRTMPVVRRASPCAS